MQGLYGARDGISRNGTKPKSVARRRAELDAFLRAQRKTRNLNSMMYAVHMSYLVGNVDMAGLHVERPAECLSRGKSRRRLEIVRRLGERKAPRKKGKGASSKSTSSNSAPVPRIVEAAFDSESESEEGEEIEHRWTYIEMAGCWFWVSSVTGIAQLDIPPGHVREEEEAIRKAAKEQSGPPKFKEFSKDLGTGAAVYDSGDYEEAMRLLCVDSGRSGECRTDTTECIS